MIKTGCQCFTCRHKDEPRVVAGYLQGCINASNWFINWASRNNIKQGSISDDDLGGILAQMILNRDESECILAEYPNLEEEHIDEKGIIGESPTYIPREEGNYWVEKEGLGQFIDEWHKDYADSGEEQWCFYDNPDKILGKVPSFEEWKSSDKLILTLMDNIKDKSDLLQQAMVKKAELKQLLEECKPFVELCNYTPENKKLLDSICQSLQEK